MANLKNKWSISSTRIVEFHELPDDSFFRLEEDTSHKIHFKTACSFRANADNLNTVSVTYPGLAAHTDKRRRCIEVVQVQEAKFIDLFVGIREDEILP